MRNSPAYDFSALGMRTAPLLVVLGADGDIQEKKQGGFRMGGNSDIYKLLPETCPFEQLNLSKRFMRQQGRPDLSRYECILNLVTDPDQHPQTLERLRKMLRGHSGRVINRPEAVLRSTRDQVAKRLEGLEGLRVPKVLRLRNPKPGAASAAAARAGMHFPVIARMAGTHTGKIIGLVDDAQGLDAACAGRGEFILIEFVDFRSDDGLYRKYRLWSFGPGTVFKHVIISDDWNVHHKDRNRVMSHRPGLIEEEVRLFARPEGALPAIVHGVFEAIRSRIGLDFFGMDFGIDQQGQTVLFEANATMTFAMSFEPPFKYLELANAPARQALCQMLFPDGRAAV